LHSFPTRRSSDDVGIVHIRTIRIPDWVVGWRYVGLRCNLEGNRWWRIVTRWFLVWVNFNDLVDTSTNISNLKIPFSRNIEIPNENSIFECQKCETSRNFP